MHRSLRRLALATALVIPGVVHAQSSQPYAFQISALGTGILVQDGILFGIGVEPQFRFNQVHEFKKAGLLSIGIGGQFTSHKSGDGYTLKVKGAFLEPRLVLPGNRKRVFPYLAARVAFMQQSSDFLTSSSGFAFGGGGGVVVKMSSNINLDAGAALLYQSFSDAQTSSGPAQTYTFGGLASYAAKIGVNIGFP